MVLTYFHARTLGKSTEEKRQMKKGVRGDPWKVLKTCFQQDMMSLLLSDDE